MEMLCIMHEASPYGHLVIGGRAVGNDILARMAGTDMEEVSALLIELRNAGVFSITRKGVIYSRRMIRDANRSEKARKSVEKRWSGPHLEDTENKQKSTIRNTFRNTEPITQKPEARDQKERKPPSTAGPPSGAASAAPMASSKPAAPPGNEFDRVQAECSRALGDKSLADLVIGPMVELVRKYGQERVSFQLQSEARRARKTPVKRWALWAAIVEERLAEAHGLDPPKHRETGPKIDVGNGVPWLEENLKRSVENWRERPETWAPQWGRPPDENEKIRRWAEENGILLRQTEGNA
jgi:hypothetical protein